MTGKVFGQSQRAHLTICYVCVSSNDHHHLVLVAGVSDPSSPTPQRHVLILFVIKGQAEDFLNAEKGSFFIDKRFRNRFSFILIEIFIFPNQKSSVNTCSATGGDIFYEVKTVNSFQQIWKSSCLSSPPPSSSVLLCWPMFFFIFLCWICQFPATFHAALLGARWKMQTKPHSEIYQQFACQRSSPRRRKKRRKSRQSINWSWKNSSRTRRRRTKALWWSKEEQKGKKTSKKIKKMKNSFLSSKTGLKRERIPCFYLLHAFFRKRSLRFWVARVVCVGQLTFATFLNVNAEFWPSFWKIDWNWMPSEWFLATIVLQFFLSKKQRSWAWMGGWMGG